MCLCHACDKHVLQTKNVFYVRKCISTNLSIDTDTFLTAKPVSNHVLMCNNDKKVKNMIKVNNGEYMSFYWQETIAH